MAEIAGHPLPNLDESLVIRAAELAQDEAQGAWRVTLEGEPHCLVLTSDAVILVGSPGDLLLRRQDISEIKSPAPFAIAFVHRGDEFAVGFDSSHHQARFLNSYGGKSAASKPEGAPVQPPDQPRSRRQRSYRMIDELATMRKYRMALAGQRWAHLSVLGTESWEDYASLAVNAMALETALDMDTRVERLEAQLGAIEGQLRRLVELAEEAARQQPDAKRNGETL